MTSKVTTSPETQFFRPSTLFRYTSAPDTPLAPECWISTFSLTRLREWAHKLFALSPPVAGAESFCFMTKEDHVKVRPVIYRCISTCFFVRRLCVWCPQVWISDLAISPCCCETWFLWLQWVASTDIVRDPCPKPSHGEPHFRTQRGPVEVRRTPFLRSKRVVWQVQHYFHHWGTHASCLFERESIKTSHHILNTIHSRVGSTGKEYKLCCLLLSSLSDYKVTGHTVEVHRLLATSFYMFYVPGLLQHWDCEGVWSPLWSTGICCRPWGGKVIY